MQSYIVLARKHRPRQLSDVVGQEHIGRTLANAIKRNRVAHALLFTGARGVGKTSTARILARAMNCEKGPTPTPCDECRSCVQILGNSSVDVIEIDAASNRGIDEIRDLRDQVRYPPSQERYKIYIIDEVHMLTTPAFNALLKTLEEPPPHVVFVLATTEPHKIPETILSRCQRFDFRRISQPLIEKHLAKIAQAEGVTAQPEAIRLVAQQSEGCMRDAQSLLDQLISFAEGEITEELASRVLGVVGRDALYGLSEAVLKKQVDAVLERIKGAYEVGANLVRLASDYLSHLRDLAVCTLTRTGDGLVHLTDGERARLKDLAELTDISTVHRMFSLLLQSAEEMSRSQHPRLILEMALIRLTAIEPVEPLGELIDKIEKLASETSGGQVASHLPPPTSHVPRATSHLPQDVVVEAPAKSAGVDHVADWTRLVHTITERNPLVGNVLKVAELVSENGLQFAAQLGSGAFAIFSSGDKIELVGTIAEELFGAGTTVTVTEKPIVQPSGKEPKDELEATAPTAPAPFSVSASDEALVEKEVRRREEVLRDHPATTLLKKVFQAEQVHLIPQAVELETILEPET
jgi:DNA polymerase-3 subunit gamma/tau